MRILPLAWALVTPEMFLEPTSSLATYLGSRAYCRRNPASICQDDLIYVWETKITQYALITTRNKWQSAFMKKMSNWW